MEVNLGLFSLIFLTEPLAPGMELASSYVPWMIGVSYLFAAFGSYVGLSISEVARAAKNKRERIAWLGAGALSFGAGVWSMHFMGMAAFQMDMPVQYDILLTGISILPAILASYYALHHLTASKNSRFTIGLGSVLVGAGIGAMHYVGMAAMHVDAAMAYDPMLFGVSIVVAVLLAWIALTTQANLKKRMTFVPDNAVKVASAAIMGLAVSGMHYTAMLAVRFFPGHHEMHHSVGADTGTLILLINILVFLLMFLVLVAIIARKVYDNEGLKEAQARLTKVEARWDFALKGTRQGVWDHDYLTDERYYSPTWKTMRGLDPNAEFEDSHQEWLERIHPDDRDAVLESIVTQNLENFPSASIEYREMHAEGHYIWIQSRGRPVSRDEDGNPLRMIGVDVDITERKRLEMQIKKNLSVIETTLDNFPGGICLYDKNLILTVANKGFYEVTDVTEEEFPIGSHVEDIYRFHAKRGEFGEGDVEAHVERLLADARSFSERTYTRYRDYDGVTLSFRRSPLPNGGYVLTVEDITKKLAAEEEKRQLEQDLSHAQKMESLGTLASGVAHEINTPIQYIGDNLQFQKSGFEDLLELLDSYKKTLSAHLGEDDNAALAAKEEELDLEFLVGEIPSSLTQSQEGIEQVARIVAAIKEFSHPIQDEMAPIDLNATIDTTITVSRNQWKYVADVETDFDADLPLVECFQGDINQVMLNLLVNAAHAIEDCEEVEHGSIHVSTKQSDGMVQISVSDNGCGMDPEVAKRIFDPFFTTKDVGKGTGQGLAISDSIIRKKHGGSINVDSTVGKGTTFTLEIPIEGIKNKKGKAA